MTNKIYPQCKSCGHHHEPDSDVLGYESSASVCISYLKKKVQRLKAEVNGLKSVKSPDLNISLSDVEKAVIDAILEVDDGRDWLERDQIHLDSELCGGDGLDFDENDVVRLEDILSDKFDVSCRLPQAFIVIEVVESLYKSIVDEFLMEYRDKCLTKA